MNKPDLVFADEPTGNLDSSSSADLLAFLRRSVTELGQSIVMVTHDPRSAAYRRVPGVASAEGEVEGYAQFVARDGKPIATGGAPALGVNFDTDQRLSSLHIIADVHHQRHRPVRVGRQPGWGEPGRVHATHRAGCASGAWPVR
jgi:energy-coupling factor transporter ATP-binding protein EcfA2